MVFYIVILLVASCVYLIIKYAEWQRKAEYLEDSIFLADIDNRFIDELIEIKGLDREYHSVLQEARLNVNKRIKSGKSLDVLVCIAQIKELKEKLEKRK